MQIHIYVTQLRNLDGIDYSYASDSAMRSSQGYPKLSAPKLNVKSRMK